MNRTDQATTVARDAADRASAWAVAETWGLQAIQLALFLLLARLLGPEAYGTLSLALTINVIGEALISEGGWLEAIVHRPQLEPSHLDTAFHALWVQGLAFAAVAAVAAPLLASIFADPSLVPLVLALAVALPLRAVAIVPEALFTRRLDFRPLAIRSLIGTGAGGAAGIALALGGFGVWSLVVQQIVQTAVAGALVWRATDWRPHRWISRPHLADLLPFVATKTVERTTLAFDTLLPRLFIGYWLGPAVLGYYTVARKVCELLTQLLTRPIARVALPSFAEAAGRPEQLRALADRVVPLTVAAVLPCFAGLALVAPELVPLAFGAAWQPAVTAVQVLALLGVSLPAERIYGALLMGIGRPGAQLATTLISVAVLAGLFAFFPPTSLAGAASLIVLRSYLLQPWVLYVAHRAARLDTWRPMLRAAPAVAGVAVMVGIVLALRAVVPPGLRAPLFLVAAVPAGAIAYGLTMGWLGRPLLRDTAAAFGLPFARR
jgi:PST family polysaccharide transporter